MTITRRMQLLAQLVGDARDLRSKVEEFAQLTTATPEMRAALLRAVPLLEWSHFALGMQFNELTKEYIDFKNKQQ